MLTVVWKQGLTLPHDPDDVADIIVDFTDIIAVGDTLVSTVIEDVGVTANLISETAEGIVTVRVTGGTVGEESYIMVQAVLNSGRKQSRTTKFHILER